MKRRTFWLTSAVLAGALATVQPFGDGRGVHAQAATPKMLDVVSGLDSPIGVAFLDRHEMLVLEKNSGRCNLSSTAWAPPRCSTSA